VRDFGDRFPWIPTFRAAEAFVLAETGDTDAARIVVERLAPDDFDAIPRDGIWTIGMWSLAGATARIEEPAWAEKLRELLLPVADCALALGGSMYMGPAGTALGMLSRVLGRYDEGAEHFEGALRDVEQIGARPFQAQTAHEYAILLRRRRATGDDAHAAALEAEAESIASDLGMEGLLKDIGLMR
jgi:hypothetical protein